MSCCIHRRVARWVVAFAAYSLFAGVTGAVAQEEAAVQGDRAHARAGEEAVLAALAAATEVDFEETPLNEAIAFLEERHGIEIEVDAVAVEEAGATIDAPASLAVRGVSLRSVLNLLLRPHGLTWIIEHGLLTVTSREAAENSLVTRVYTIGDLLKSDAEATFNADHLIDVLQQTVSPQSWDEVGGAGSISHVPSGLVISQTLVEHEEIGRLLADLRRVVAGEPPENAGDPAAPAILSALAADAEAAYVDVPLEEVIGLLAERHGLQVIFARSAIEEAGATIDFPHSVEVRGVSLRNLLELVLDKHGLTWIVRDEVLVVTSKEAADNMLRNRVYPVADILAKGFEGSYGVDDLSDMIQGIVAPQSWDEVGGPGSIPTYPGALVVRQTQPVHEEIERLLAMLRELPAEEFPQQARTRLMVYTVAGADPEELAGMIRVTIDVASWAQHRQGGEGTIQPVRALPPSLEEKPATNEPLANEAQGGLGGVGTPSAELPQFLPGAMKRPPSGWLLIRQSRENLRQIESLLWGMDVLQDRWPSAGNGSGGGFFSVPSQ